MDRRRGGVRRPVPYICRCVRAYIRLLRPSASTFIYGVLIYTRTRTRTYTCVCVAIPFCAATNVTCPANFFSGGSACATDAPKKNARPASEGKYINGRYRQAGHAAEVPLVCDRFLLYEYSYQFFAASTWPHVWGVKTRTRQPACMAPIESSKHGQRLSVRRGGTGEERREEETTMMMMRRRRAAHVEKPLVSACWKRKRAPCPWGRAQGRVPKGNVEAPTAEATFGWNGAFWEKGLFWRCFKRDLTGHISCS